MMKEIKTRDQTSVFISLGKEMYCNNYYSVTTNTALWNSEGKPKEIT